MGYNITIHALKHRINPRQVTLGYIESNMSITRLSSVLPLWLFSSPVNYARPVFSLTCACAPPITFACWYEASKKKEKKRRKNKYKINDASFRHEQPRNVDVIKFLWAIISSIAARPIYIFNERERPFKSILYEHITCLFQKISPLSVTWWTEF